MLNESPFLTVALLEEVFSEFVWPEPYVLKDDGPDSIQVAFPKTNFYFHECPEGEIIVQFSPRDTLGENGLHLGHALLVFVPIAERRTRPISPGLITNESPFPSPQKTRDGIHNACINILTHCRHVIGGDYSWVPKYLEMRRSDAST